MISVRHLTGLIVAEPRESDPSLIGQWGDLLRDAPHADLRELGCLVCMAPVFALIFAAAWWMLPA
ncbi:hypothetical protein [Novosphingobium sp. KN65.2]|uniref:hypothetical protein n=1 Tax=Novosphingobium sp. KN65.2 TaxID=1478134 RepID=UPI0005E02231|nr:hypothetical protein [Novosphingobium sp. KN65.2]CDO35027.1 hypothetical protein SPHV1_2180039 [Novosphingobium sp. KN65.2]